MNQKDFSNRVRKVFCSIAIFFILFLCLGFLLKSKYPMSKYDFNTQDAYQVITDGLTLSAYFLAPAIAYILFTDWRDQHRRVKNEKVSIDILHILDNVLQHLNVSVERLMDKNEYNKYQQNYISLLIDLKNKNKLINPNCSESIEFISKIDDITNLMHNFLLNLQKQIIMQQQYEIINVVGEQWDEVRNNYLNEIYQSRDANSKNLITFMDTRKILKILYV